ncbi:MAG: GIY-YIG nuclease family protein [Victivallales bacterium]|nr:GIY-YIG nuclease family protein [Victivallales bacterium]
MAQPLKLLMMYYVYILKSNVDNSSTYVGYTSDLKSRLTKHNEGGCPHTSKYKPWKLIWYCAFHNKIKALEFEKYLKSHSGKAFTTKHLL